MDLKSHPTSELVLSGASKAAAGDGEEASAFLRVMDSLLELHRAVVEARVKLASAAVIDASSTREGS